MDKNKQGAFFVVGVALTVTAALHGPREDPITMPPDGHERPAFDLDALRARHPAFYINGSNTRPGRFTIDAYVVAPWE